MMTEQPRICAETNCNNALVQRASEPPNKFLRRMTCCASCGSKYGMRNRAQNSLAAFGGGDQTWRTRDWPSVTGETDWNGAFAAHNLVVGDGGMFRLMRPATHVEGGGR